MIIAKLLQPSESESGGLYVGDLTIALIRRATADLQPILPELLRAFALRLATAATATFGQVRLEVQSLRGIALTILYRALCCRLHTSSTRRAKG